MPRPVRVLPATVDLLIAHQAGVVSRAQLTSHGVGTRVAQDRVEAGRWVRVHPGVWVTFTGPAPEATRTWAALLYCGEGAVVAGRSALRLSRALDGASGLGGRDRAAPTGGAKVEPVHIAVPHERRVRAQPGVCVVRRRDLSRMAVTTASPPRVRLEDAVLDVADEAFRFGEVIGLVTDVLQARATTTTRLRDALAARPRHRWRLLSTATSSTSRGA